MIEKLCDNLEPVRRMPRLRTMILGVFASWLVVAAVVVALSGVRPDLVDRIVEDFFFISVLVGIGFFTLGGLMACLASAIPGREGCTLLGKFMVLLGGLTTLGVVAANFGDVFTSKGTASQMETAMHCFSHACLMSVIPMGVVIAFVLRGWLNAPLRTAFATGVGAVGMGTLIVHASCVKAGTLHMMLGHLLAPFFGALLLLLPLGWYLQRRQKAQLS